jgi:hypothetical protein
MLVHVLLATNALVVKQSPMLAPVLKLRGGLGGLDANQVANGASYLYAINAGVMALAPEKAAEMYGIQNPSALTSQFAEWAGGAMLMVAIASILSLGGSMDFATALGWGSLPSLVQNVQGMLKGTAGKLGFGQAAKFMPTLVSAVLTAGLFGKGLETALAMKITAAWMGLNGAACYLITGPFMKAWEAPAMTVVEESMAKFFGGVMATAGVFTASVAFLEKDPLTAIAYAWATAAATQVCAQNPDPTFHPPPCLFPPPPVPTSCSLSPTPAA